VERQLEWLGEVNPDYLLSHTSNLELLAGLLRDRPQYFPRLRAVQAISETLTDEAREKIEAAFGAPVKNLYSCAEGGYLASPCPAGHGLHVHAENVLLEVLDDAGRPCAPGETGRAVLTVLHSFLTPFMRYEIGDLLSLAPTRCPCGRGLPLLTGVLGKLRPLFRLANGGWKHSSGLVHALSAVGGHHQHQAVQKAIDHVLVRVVPSLGWTADHPHRIRQAVQGFLGAPVRVDVEVRERLELPRGGQLQSMVCEVPPGEAV
jgi:phenylacetate-CoA ligase